MASRKRGVGSAAAVTSLKVRRHRCTRRKQRGSAQVCYYRQLYSQIEEKFQGGTGEQMSFALVPTAEASVGSIHRGITLSEIYTQRRAYYPSRGFQEQAYHSHGPVKYHVANSTFCTCAKVSAYNTVQYISATLQAGSASSFQPSPGTVPQHSARESTDPKTAVGTAGILIVEYQQMRETSTERTFLSEVHHSRTLANFFVKN